MLHINNMNFKLEIIQLRNLKLEIPTGNVEFLSKQTGLFLAKYI